MINLEYTATPQETSQATMRFLSNRPAVSFMFGLMKFICILLFLGFAASVYYKSVRPQDIVSVIAALIWFFYYKTINQWIIKSALKSRKFTEAKYSIAIDEQSILCRFDGDNIQYIEWKKLKHIIDTKDGYIIPLTGFTNAGKFIWLPLRAFPTPKAKQEFLDLVSKFKLKVKDLKS